MATVDGSTGLFTCSAKFAHAGNAVLKRGIRREISGRTDKISFLLPHRCHSSPEAIWGGTNQWVVEGIMFCAHVAAVILAA